MNDQVQKPTRLLTSIHGKGSTSVTGVWPIQEDEAGTYIVVAMPRRYVSPKRGMVSFESRLYFDLARAEPDPEKSGRCFLRAGLKQANAKDVEIDPSGGD